MREHAGIGMGRRSRPIPNLRGASCVLNAAVAGRNDLALNRCKRLPLARRRSRLPWEGLGPNPSHCIGTPTRTGPPMPIPTNTGPNLIILTITIMFMTGIPVPTPTMGMKHPTTRKQ
jgi:hypothetical protein